MRAKLDPGLAVTAMVLRVLREHLAAAIDAARSTRSSTKTRIHIARTACRKARAAMKLLRAEDRGFFQRENRRLRQAARRFSRLRDADARMECFKALVQRTAPPGQRAGLERLRRALVAQQRATLPVSAEVERSLARFARRVEAVDERLAGWAPAGDFAGVVKGFRRTYKRARAGLFAAQTIQTDESFHDWRKSAKAYAHQCRLLRSAWPDAMRERRKELKGLAALLGDEHDLTVLRQHLRRLDRNGGLGAAEAGLQPALQRIDAERAALRAAAISLGERLFADRPRSVAARLQEWWRIAAARATPASGAGSPVAAERAAVRRGSPRRPRRSQRMTGDAA